MNRGARRLTATWFAFMIAPVAALASFDPLSATVTVDAAKVVRTMDRRLLAGSNVAAWFAESHYTDPQIRSWMQALGPTVIRLPGGSWGDVLWWNGNGVRRTSATELDTSRHDPKPYSPWSAPFGVWNVDYSGWAPGFNSFQGKSDGWHGHVDVKTMHEWIRDTGSEALVIVNGGQGSPRDAAEWVRWAKQMNFPVRYWEVGNELGGSWEAGNLLPDGTRLNGRIYARRYEEFARAMKAVDPTIRIGTMDWIEDVLKHCGELVDFVSIHTYPVNGSETDAELFGKVGVIRREVEPVRELIRRWQPKRADTIEIGYSEWNMHVPDTRGLIWNALFLGEMFRQGVNFSNNFHVFDVMQPGPPARRHVNYWAFWLWRHAMGDMLTASSVAGPESIAAYATRTDEGCAIMLSNGDPDREARVRLALDGFTPAARGRVLRISRREHLWLDRQPGVPDWRKSADWIWSSGPGVEDVAVSPGMALALPPASLTVLQIPTAGRSLPALELPMPAVAAKRAPRIEIWLPPKTAYADSPVEGWVLARAGAGSGPHPRPLPDAKLRITGAAVADRATVRLAEAAGRFILTASKPGRVTLEATVAGVRARTAVEFLPTIPRPRILWEFEEDSSDRLRSHWKAVADPSIRPNQRVVRVDLNGDNPATSKKQEMLVITDFPPGDRLDRSNIRGAFFDVKTSADFRCDDPEARITVVMQSPMNWWMVLGTAPLAGPADWKTITVPVEKPEHLRAMPGVHNLMLLLNADRPVHGSIYVDRAGLMVR